MDIIKLPNEKQQQMLCKLLHLAFIEIRLLGWQHKPTQAAELADAVHNIPIYMNSDKFNWTLQKHMIDTYQNRQECRITNFSKWFDNIILTKEVEFADLFTF